MQNAPVRIAGILFCCGASRAPRQKETGRNRGRPGLAVSAATDEARVKTARKETGMDSETKELMAEVIGGIVGAVLLIGLPVLVKVLADPVF